MKENFFSRAKEAAFKKAASFFAEGVVPQAILAALRIKVAAFGTVSPDNNVYIAPRPHDGHGDTLVVTDGADQQGKKNIEVVVSGDYWGPFLQQLLLNVVYGERYYLTHPKEKAIGDEGFVASEVNRIKTGEKNYARVVYPEGGRGRAGQPLQTGIFAVAAELALNEGKDVPIQLAVLEDMDPVFRKKSNAVLDVLWLLVRAGRYRLTNKYHVSTVTFLEPLNATRLAALTDPDSVEALKQSLVTWYEGQYEEYLNKDIYSKMPDAFMSHFINSEEGKLTEVTIDDSEVFNKPTNEDRYRFISQDNEYPPENQV